MIRTAVLTISDRCSRGERIDESGPLLVSLLEEGGASVVSTAVVSDDASLIVHELSSWIDEGVTLIVTTGGTGLGERDVTPEAVARLGGRDVPGVAEAIRAAGRSKTPFAMLSRQVARQVDRTLVVCLPGSPSAVSDGVMAIKPVLPHLARMLDDAHAVH